MPNLWNWTCWICHSVFNVSFLTLSRQILQFKLILQFCLCLPNIKCKHYFWWRVYVRHAACLHLSSQATQHGSSPSIVPVLSASIWLVGMWVKPITGPHGVMYLRRIEDHVLSEAVLGIHHEGGGAVCGPRADR